MPTYLSPGIYVEEREAGPAPINGVGTAVAAFVGLTAKGPVNEPILITNWTQYVTQFGEPIAGAYLGQAVFGYLINGGSRAYIVRVGAPAMPADTSVRSTAELTTDADRTVAAYVATALDSSDSPIEVEVSDAGEGAPEGAFQISVRRGDEHEVFVPVTTRRGRSNFITTVNSQSKLIHIEECGNPQTDAARRPANGTVTLIRKSDAQVVPTAEHYIGSAAGRTGFGGLETIDQITMLCVPDLVAALESGAIDEAGFRAAQTAMIDHCELMGDRIAILDPPPEQSAQQVYEWRTDSAGYDSKFATLYYPMLNVQDPSTGDLCAIPPSGHIAGVWARNDAERGVHKAPANETIRGVIGVANPLTRAEHDLLNPAGINCIRPFRGRGIRVFGARTLSSDPLWRYVNVRRLYNYVESSLRTGTHWVVFEPNDRALWERLSRTIRAFLYLVWLDGGLFGETPDEAYYVKCNDETNPSEAIEAGQLICEIGMAVVKPAEFVIFRLAQLPTGTSQIQE